MPPSPSSRRFPVREIRTEGFHTRGRSLESKFPLRAKDDDLVLFNEMQNRERDNFLLHSSDDFDDSISKLKYFPNFKLGITIPAQGESSDLLNADGEKHDYDWLLTPPETPLFPSLDDDEPQPTNVSRGRIRSQPISISRTSTSEKTSRTNRSSASPCRLSSSPTSSSSVTHSRTRPSSVPRSSPLPVPRSATPSRRPSTPPAKPSPLTQRSSTPTVRRMSTGSTGPAYSSTRGTSPVRTNRGNSSSPKLRGWQSNLPGFSTDAPPNLRTSLTDRSTSRVRGLSPASTNGTGSSKFRRQSISPSASRSASSSQNSERNPFSSISKPSVSTSCDDDTDSHASVGVSPIAATRKYGAFANSRAVMFSKKPSRSSSASSVPKRSFDSALRQMDHHKAPQDMFRPLLSSVPASTFYVGKTTNVHRPMFSRYSSLTTSSNTSSEHGASVVPDLEDNDHDRSVLTGELEKTQDPSFQEEVFILDEISEHIGNDTCSAKLQSGNEISDSSVPNKINTKLDHSSGNDSDSLNTSVACRGSHGAECSKIDSNETMSICLKCDRHFVVTDIDVDVCEECSGTYGSIGSEEPRTIRVGNQGDRNDTMDPKVQPQIEIPELTEIRTGIEPCQHEQSSEEVTHISVDSGLFLLANDKRDENLSEQEVLIPAELYAPESSSNYESQQSQPTPSQIDQVDNSESTGIAVVLMNKSSSRKWPVVQGKAFSAANIFLAESSHGRDNINVMKHSLGRDSSSASSSLDMGSRGQTDGHILRQLSSTKYETQDARGESHTGTQGCGPHSKTSSIAIETLVHSQIETEEVSCSIIGAVESDAIEKILSDAQNPERSFGDKDLNVMKHTSTEQAVVGINVSGNDDTSLATCVLPSQASQHISLQMCDDIVESSDSCEHAKEVLSGNSKRSPEVEAPIATPDSSSIEGNHTPSATGCQDDVADVATHCSSVATLDEQNDMVGFQDLHDDCTSQMPNSVEDFQEDSISTSDKDVLISEVEPKIAEDPSSEEPIITVEAPRKIVQRSFTLEEATDTILFCSSIVHDVAHKAATIAMEKESALYESSYRAVTFMGNSVSNKKDLQKMATKNNHRSRKINRKKLAAANEMPSVEVRDNVKNSELASCNAEALHTGESVKPPKLESKCNCTVM
ncbi:unnamed protein product [Musa hybrid cultivar]